VYNRAKYQAPMREALEQWGEYVVKRKRPANHASHFGIEYENVHALTGKLMGTHNDRYGSVWS